jgi:hypothetical protein
MKKYFAGIAAAAIVSAPFAANALEALDNSAMKSTTGQAGVSIAIDDIVIYQTGIADVTYIDNDGVTSYVGFEGSHATTTYGNVTAAGLMIDYSDNFQKLVLIDAILDDTTYGVAAMDAIISASDPTNSMGLLGQVGIMDAAAIGAEITAGTWDASIGQSTANGFLNGISPLSIDIGTCQALSAGLAWNEGGAALDVAGVVIGLPTVEITQFHTTDEFSVKILTGGALSGVAADGTGGAINGGAFGNNEVITIRKSGVSRMAILGGRLEIAPH